MILHIRHDGSGEDALAQAVSQHRAGFTAGVDLQAAREWCDTMPAPEAGHAASEFLADDDENHAPTPRDRARQFRRIGICALVATLAVLGFADRISSPPPPQPKAVPSLGVWA